MYDMLVCALEYRPAIKAIVDDSESELRAFEISAEEWGIVEELCGVLKVCAPTQL